MKNLIYPLSAALTFLASTALGQSYMDDLNHPLNPMNPVGLTSPFSPNNPVNMMNNLNSPLGSSSSSEGDSISDYSYAGGDTYTPTADAEAFDVSKSGFSRGLSYFGSGYGLRLRFQTLKLSGYEDPTCLGMSTRYKDCNPEFQIKMVVCSQSSCTSKPGWMSPYKPIVSPIFSPQTTRGVFHYNQDIINVSSWDFAMIALLEKVMNKDPAEVYYLGFELVESNKHLPDFVKAKKLWKISDIRAHKGKGPVLFDLATKDKKVHARFEFDIE